MNLVFELIFGKSGIYITGSILNGNPGCCTCEHITIAYVDSWNRIDFRINYSC
jgi:hypothetical protein